MNASIWSSVRSVHQVMSPETSVFGPDPVVDGPDVAGPEVDPVVPEVDPPDVAPVDPWGSLLEHAARTSSSAPTMESTRDQVRTLMLPLLSDPTAPRCAAEPKRSDNPVSSGSPRWALHAT